MRVEKIIGNIVYIAPVFPDVSFLNRESRAKFEGNLKRAQWEEFIKSGRQDVTVFYPGWGNRWESDRKIPRPLPGFKLSVLSEKRGNHWVTTFRRGTGQEIIVR